MRIRSCVIIYFSSIMPLGYLHYEFATPWAGLAALAVVLALTVALRRRFPSLLVSSQKPFNPAGNRQSIFNPLRFPAILEAIGLLFLVIAFMRPQYGIDEIVQRSEGVDIILALDVSGSMEAYDIPEGLDEQRRIEAAIKRGEIMTRLDIAKSALTDFIRNRPADRIGLIAFARYAYILSPPTLDHDFLLDRLEDVEPDDIPDGTGIAAPITSATQRLKESDAERRVLVFFTDGRDNVDSPVSPRQAAKVANSFDITLYTVGVGSDRSVIKTDSPFGERLRSGLAGYNEQLLKEIAQVAEGDFLKAENAEKFRQVMSEIDKLEKATSEQTVYTDYEEKFPHCLAAGLALLITAFALKKTILQPVP